eukprot:gene18431-biopygen15979
MQSDGVGRSRGGAGRSRLESDGVGRSQTEPDGVGKIRLEYVFPSLPTPGGSGAVRGRFGDSSGTVLGQFGDGSGTRGLLRVGHNQWAKWYGVRRSRMEYNIKSHGVGRSCMESGGVGRSRTELGGVGRSQTEAGMARACPVTPGAKLT